MFLPTERDVFEIFESKKDGFYIIFEYRKIVIPQLGFG